MAPSNPPTGKKRKNIESQSIQDAKKRKTVKEEKKEGYKTIPYKNMKKGFWNLFNTCYIGSALQVLAMDEDLLQLILRIPSECENPGNRKKVLSLQLALLCCLRDKSTKKSNVAAMEYLCQEFELNQERTGDASEILQTLIELIECKTKGTNLEADFHKYFCSRDGSSKFQPTTKFVDGGSKSLEQALCDVEEKTVEAPRLQVICVNRLKYDKIEKEMVRMNEKFKFPTEFSTSLLYAGENKTFRLKGVIAHQYKENFPHYTVYARTTDGVDIQRKAISKPVITVPKSNAKLTQKKGGRASRCKTCVNCLAKECGECKYCKDKPKYGGKNVLKKACSERQCLGLSEKKEPTNSMLDYVTIEDASEHGDPKEADRTDSYDRWLHYDDVTVEEASIAKVLNLAGNPNGSLDQGLATVLVYASHNTAPSNQIEVSNHILEAFDGLTASPATIDPGCIIKLVDPGHIFSNTTMQLVNQESLLNIKFDVSSEEMDETISDYLGSRMHIQPNHLQLYTRREQDVLRVCIDRNATLRSLIQEDAGVVPEIKCTYEIINDESNDNATNVEGNCNDQSDDGNGISFPVAVKLFDEVNKTFLLYSMDRVNPSESVKNIWKDEKSSFSVGILVEEKFVKLDPDTLFHSVFQMAGSAIPVLLVQKKKIGEEVGNQEKLEDYVKREFDTMEVVLRGDRDESRIRVFVGAEIDQVYNQIGEAVQHPGDNLQLSYFHNSALSCHFVSDLKKTLVEMLANKIPRILKVTKLDMSLRDFLTRKIPYTIEVLQMTSFCTEKITTDVELDDTDLTVDQLTKVITENLKENMPADSELRLVKIRSRKIISILSPQDKVADHVDLKPGKVTELAAIRLPAKSVGKRLISCFTFTKIFYNMAGCPGLLVLPEELTVSQTDILDYIKSKVNCRGFECRKPTNAPADFDECSAEEFCPVLTKDVTTFKTIICIQLTAQ